MERTQFISHGIAGGIGALLAMLVIGIGVVYVYEHKPELLTQYAPTDDTEISSEEIFSDEARIVAAVEKANPAVVAITVSKNVPVYERYYENQSFGPFGMFFSVPQVRQRGTELQEVGGGSGFLVSSDGYIVTNRHVVSDEDATYTVFTNDGNKYEADVIARDPQNDIAVLKIEGDSFEYLPFGNSDDLKVGQSVVAIGNALAEFRNTVSVGVVSGLSRSITASARFGGDRESLSELIQTDAAINQGNSGGPLLNLSGEVVGVNVAIVSGAQNVGFALSANSVKNVVESVKATGKISRPFLGVRYVPITEVLQERNNLSVDYGVLIQRGATIEDLAVLPGSPADKAGLRENDIILEVDGKKLDDSLSLQGALSQKQVGQRVTLKILSKGEERTVEAVLEEMST